MKPMGNARAHYFRTLKMAKAAGVPLATALQNGTLKQADYAEMITKCRRCPQPGHCEALLQAVDKIRTIPEYCANRNKLDALRM